MIEVQTGTTHPQVSRAAVPERFEVRDGRTANWVVRKVVEARAYAGRVEAWAAAEVRRVRREEQWLLRHFGGQLQGWVEAQLAVRGGRCRSLRLPGGQVGFRSTPATVMIADQHVLAAWCREHLPHAYGLRVASRGEAAHLLRDMIGESRQGLAVREEVFVSEVKKHLDVTGELPPGAAVMEPRQRFFIK